MHWNDATASTNPPNITQIRKLIMSLEDWDDNIWGALNTNDLDKDNSYHPPESPPLPVRPITKSEVTTRPWGGVEDKNLPPERLVLSCSAMSQPSWLESWGVTTAPPFNTMKIPSRWWKDVSWCISPWNKESGSLHLRFSLCLCSTWLLCCQGTKYDA